jgi:hypothetical protein
MRTKVQFVPRQMLVFATNLHFRLDDTAYDNPVGLKKLKSLILLTYYDDDNPVQTCEEKLLLKLLRGERQLLIIFKSCCFLAQIYLGTTFCTFQN